MFDSLTNDQESRRLIREELSTNILVEAGAGSGKTQMLANRMAGGVAAGVYHVEHIAAVTFSRKAASELRGRFHLSLEEELSRSALDSERSDRVQSALSNLERFFAGTIHSFCARLLRERPVEFGVSPGFTELDETQDLELRQRSWRDFVTSARGAGDSDMMALLQAGIRPTDLDSAFATVSANDDVEFPPGEAERPNPKPAWEALEKFWTDLQKHLPAEIDGGTTCLIQKAARQFRAELRVSQYRLDRPSVVASLLDEWDCESKITQKWWSDSPADKKRLRDVIQPLHAQFHAGVVEPYLAQWRQYVYRLSVGILVRAREHTATERRRLNTLNYGDLLNLTARVLRENKVVRRALQEKFQFVLVDEFQDTDPVQAEILFWLAEDEVGPSAINLAGASDWRRVRLRPGALFVVGDPKQSIFRFRWADIDIYNIVRQRFSDPAVGRVVPLTMNFRSVPQLCDWANTVFKTRFPTEPTPYAPRFAALDSAKSKTLSGGVFTLTHTCDQADLQSQDATNIATYIRAEVDFGRRRFSDFLILTRKKRGRIAPYAHALESLNVAIEVSGAGAFGDSVEVKTLIVLLRALADPQDALSLLAVLRGALFGISDADLFAFKQAGGWFTVFHEPAAAAIPQSDVHAALASLRQYYRWTRILPAGAALDRILEHTGYLAMAATTPGGADAGDVLHAVDRVRQVMEEGGSLADAADSLEDDSEAINEVESLPLEPGRTDVVRLMNLHKAKGLEAAVVFLADPSGGVTPRVGVHIERTELKPCGWFKVVRKTQGSYVEQPLAEHADWPAHERAELPYLQAEEDRLMYVAATRAREMLIISRWTGNQKRKAWGVLNDFLADSKELPVPHQGAVSHVEPLDCSVEQQTAAVTSRIAVNDTASKPSWSITSVTSETQHIARMTRSEDTELDDATKVVGTDSPAHRADAGIAWGTLIHGLLEHAMRYPSVTRDDLRRLATWLIVEEPQLRVVIEQALETVEHVARADFWQLAKNQAHSVETPFLLCESGRLTSGVIDLLYQTSAGWQIIDYKSDVSLTPDIYQGQLDAYRAALRTIGCDVVDASVVSVRED